jgi:hypothetical protein
MLFAFTRYSIREPFETIAASIQMRGFTYNERERERELETTPILRRLSKKRREIYLFFLFSFVSLT